MSNNSSIEYVNEYEYDWNWIYKEFLDKFTKFMNLSELIMSIKQYRKNYTREMAEKVLYETIPDFNPVQILGGEYKNIIDKLTDNFMPCAKLFRPYRSMDYSFLDKYNENIKKTLIQQINHDSGNIKISDERMYEFIYNIDDLITVSEFYLGISNQLSLALDINCE